MSGAHPTRGALIGGALALLLSGCVGTAGQLDEQARSRVQVADAQARVIRHVRAEHACRFVCGVALDDPALYAGAMEALRREARLDGAMALAHLLPEELWEGVWPLYYTRRLILTAQVVRFGAQR